MLGQKWWPIGCDPYKITTEDFKQELLGLDLEIYFLNPLNTELTQGLRKQATFGFLRSFDKNGDK